VISRGLEEQRLHGALARAAAGDAGVMGIVGAAGVGKTSLVTWAEDHAKSVDANFRVIRVTGTENHTEQPLAVANFVVRQLPEVGQFLSKAQHRAIRALLRDQGAAPADPKALTAAVLRLLTSAAVSYPLLLAVDDLHWVDTASLAILDFVAQRLRADRILVLFATRSPSPINASGQLPTIHLAGMNAAEATSVIADVRPGSLDPAVVDELVLQTGGSPLALSELAIALTPDQLAGRHPLPDPLPLGPAGRASFGSLVRRLPPRTRLAVLVAALASDRTPQVMLPALASLGLQPFDLDAAVDRHVLLPQTWTFTHPLLRSASHDLASARDIRRVHLILAQIFRDADLPQHAWHLAAAAGGVDEPTAAALEQAATTEARRGERHAAERFWQLAVDLSPPGPARVRRLVATAECQLLSGNRLGAINNVDQALAANVDVAAMSRGILVKAALLVWSRNVSADLAQLGDEAERVAETDRAAAGDIFINMALAAESIGEIHEALRLATRGMELMPVGGSPSHRQSALAVLGQITMLVSGRSGDLPPAITPVEIHQQLRGANHMWPSVQAQWLLWSERYEDSDAIRRAALAGARREALSAATPVLLALGAELHWWRGNWDLGRTSAAGAVRLAQQMQQVGLLGYAYSFEALYALQRQDHARASAALRNAESIIEEFGTLPAGLYVQRVRLHGALATGDLQSALRAGVRAEMIRRQVPIQSMTVVPYLPEYVEAAVRSKDRRVGALLDELAGYAEANGSPWTKAAWLRCAGLAATKGWRQHFDDALRLTSLERTPFEHARTLECLGERLIQAGRLGEARRALREVDATYAGLGSTLWRRRSTALLARAGGLSVSMETTDVSLTAQELNVCRLVAEGATNRQAAQELFVSEKTVEYHLHKAMTKTGALNRTQLARLIGDGQPRPQVEQS
jgi:DNA-binding CsgD family transcriptional regulator/tetratricopeptide (TPR) repeat protein